MEIEEIFSSMQMRIHSLAEDAKIFPTHQIHKNAMFSFRARAFLGIDTSRRRVRKRSSVTNVVLCRPTCPLATD